MSDFGGFQEGFELVNELGAELAAVIQLHGKIEERHWARLVLRSTFALMEGFVSRFKGRALEVQEYGKVTFSPKLLRILQEGESIMRPDGTVEWDHVRPRTADNVKGSLRAYSSALGTTTPLGGDTPLPTEFSIALAARNRVTHPKTVADLAVAKDELRAAGELMQWFMDISGWSRDQELRGLEESKAKIERDTDALIAKWNSEYGEFSES